DSPYEDGTNTLNIIDGIPQNGKVIRYDFSVDTLYANSAQTELFTGVVKPGVSRTLTIAETSTGQTISELNGNVIENGASLTSYAFEKGLAPLIPGGRYLVTICVILFGISTSISWSYYGDRSIQYLMGDRSIIYYRAVYVLMHFVGAILSLTMVWTIGDLALGLMTIPNLIALFALSGVVYKLTQDYFKRMGL